MRPGHSPIQGHPPRCALDRLSRGGACDDAPVTSVVGLMIRWGLVQDGPATRGWMSTVWPVRTQDGRLMALKVVDDQHPPSGEDVALRAWESADVTAGRAVRLLTGEGRVLLLERLDAQRSLADHSQPEADDMIGQLIGALTSVAAPPELPRASHEARRIASRIEANAMSGVVPADQVQRALATLNDVPDGDRLLHFDLHYLNVLRDLDDTRWVAIDPLPQAGVREWEVAAALRNRWPDVAADPDRLLRERLRRLCTPGDLDESLAAAITQAVAVQTLLDLLPTDPDHLHVPPYLVMAGW